MIELRPYKRNTNPSLGFAWADIIRPAGCGACAWYGERPAMDVISGRFKCPACGGARIFCFPGIEPDVLQ